MDRLNFDFEFKFASGSETGKFSGYGAAFGNIDSYQDVIERGAFKDTLKIWEGKGKYPPMLLMHGGGFLGGAEDMLPVGKWNFMEENSKGLKVDGQLFALGTERGQYIYEGMKAGELDGLSIGFKVKDYTAGRKPGDPRRTLKKVDLVEVSIVTFPANDKARVGNVKSADDIKTIREYEEFLHKSGFSRSHAATLARRGWQGSDIQKTDDVKQLADWLEKARLEIERN